MGRWTNSNGGEWDREGVYKSPSPPCSPSSLSFLYTYMGGELGGLNKMSPMFMVVWPCVS